MNAPPNTTRSLACYPRRRIDLYTAYPGTSIAYPDFSFFHNLIFPAEYDFSRNVVELRQGSDKFMHGYPIFIDKL